MTIGQMEDKDAYIIHIGMNDKNAYEQIIDTDAVVRIIKSVCNGYGVLFSTYLQQGGYIHSDGNYIQEKSAAIKLIGISEDDVNNVAADLCCFLNQETELIEKRTCSYYTVSETLE